MNRKGFLLGEFTIKIIISILAIVLLIYLLFSMYSTFSAKNEIKKAQALLQNLVDYYNYRQVHSTTHEIPAVRMERCIMQKKTLFRPFEIKKPFQTAKDIFCVRINRMVDGSEKYRLIILKCVYQKLRYTIM